MNQRIKALAEQAGFTYIRDEGIGWAGNHNSSLPKFAALIVRECIAKVELRKKFAIEDEHIVEHAFDLLVYDLESHFGVEE